MTSGKRQLCIALDALDHRAQTVGALRREVLVQPKPAQNGLGVSCAYFAGAPSGKEGKQNCHQTANDVGVRGALEKNEGIGTFSDARLQPDLAHAALHLVGVGLRSSGQRVERLAELDDIAVAVFPIVDESEIFADGIKSGHGIDIGMTIERVHGKNGSVFRNLSAMPPQCSQTSLRIAPQSATKLPALLHSSGRNSMRQPLFSAAVGLFVSSLAVTASSNARANVELPAKRIEVAFVLDTTGSMAGLIDGAKRKIWSIANAIVDVNPKAEIEMALVGYRDVGDEYVVKTHDMSSDIQELYGKLIKLEADGGGDTPESVNEALDTAVNNLEWSAGDDVRRILFLVGDAPPHMDYANGPKYQRVVAKAQDAGITVNTVQAGDDPETTEYWKDIAGIGKGQYFAIPQDGGQIEVETSPFDDKIIALQAQIDATIVLYGTHEKQEVTRSKMETKAAAPASVQVDNSRYYSKKEASKEIVTEGGDLVDDIRNNRRKVEDISADELPDNLKGKSSEELTKVVTEQTAKREKLETEMVDLIKKRDEYVAAEKQKQPSAPADSFDKQVIEGIKSQL